MNITCQTKEFRRNIEQCYLKYLQIFPQEGKRLVRLHQCLEAGAPIHARSEMQGHVTASAVILSADRSQMLLVHHRGLNVWIAPGGHYDLTDGELWHTAEREASEETNVSGLVLDQLYGTDRGVPLDIDIHFIPARPERNEGSHYHFDWRYVFRAPRDFEIIRATRELIDVAWKPVSSIEATSSLHPVARKIASFRN